MFLTIECPDELFAEMSLPGLMTSPGVMLKAWAAARVSDGVAWLAGRPGGFGADKEVALALREPVGAAQRRIHRDRRLRRLLPTTRDYLTGTSTTGSLPRAGGRPVEIGIVVDLDTALGRTDLPAEVPGHGIVPRM